jgi:hypothetical protein
MKEQRKKEDKSNWKWILKVSIVAQKRAKTSKSVELSIEHHNSKKLRS